MMNLEIKCKGVKVMPSIVPGSSLMIAVIEGAEPQFLDIPDVYDSISIEKFCEYHGLILGRGVTFNDPFTDCENLPAPKYRRPKPPPPPPSPLL